MSFDVNLIFVYCHIERKKVDKWKSDGCLTVNTSDDVVECSCDHMTPFAVLLVSTETSTHEMNSVKVAADTV